MEQTTETTEAKTLNQILKGLTLKQHIYMIERKIVDLALEESRGCKAKAARKLGLNRTTLSMRLNGTYYLGKKVLADEQRK